MMDFGCELRATVEKAFGAKVKAFSAKEDSIKATFESPDGSIFELSFKQRVADSKAERAPEVSAQVPAASRAPIQYVPSPTRDQEPRDYSNLIKTLKGDSRLSPAAQALLHRLLAAKLAAGDDHKIAEATKAALTGNLHPLEILVREREIPRRISPPAEQHIPMAAVGQQLQ